MGVVLIDHFNMKKGVYIFGNIADTAVIKDLHKIHDMNTCEPMDAYKLTYQQIKDALGLLLFITEKINSDIKARKVDVGSKQITYDG